MINLIVPMKKASIICMKEDKEALIKSLQKCGQIMLCNTNETSSITDTENQESLRKIEALVKELKPYSPKKGFLQGAPELDIEEFESPMDEITEVVSRSEKLLDEIALNESLKDKKLDISKQLHPWSNLETSIENLGKSSYSSSFLGILTEKNLERFGEEFEKSGFVLDIYKIENNKVYCIVTCLNENIEEAYTFLNEINFEFTELPVNKGTVSENYNNLSHEIEDLEKIILEKKEQLKDLSQKKTELLILCDQYRVNAQRNEAPYGETLETVYLDGWVREDRTEEIETAIKEVTEIYSLSLRDPLPEENPPTALKNKKAVSQYEGITSMFTSPGYGELDPNPIMAPWYWLLFGLMMGDAGYGLLMAVAMLVGKKILKPKGNTLKLMNVFLYSSVTTFICGILFGSYFGETWNPILFSPIEEPMSMLILSLVIGALHIITGMIVKAVDDIKRGHILDAIFDQFTWIFIIIGIGMMFIPMLNTIGLIIICVCGATVLFTAGRKKKGIFGKITGGLLGLYNISGYMSDILSYSRILALGLATGVVGMVMNLMAGMVAGSIPGYFFAFIIYIVGHVFNLALSMLSAYVHDCRLQYIEFYGKFYEGGGEEFKPFAIRTEHIRLK